MQATKKFPVRQSFLVMIFLLLSSSFFQACTHKAEVNKAIKISNLPCFKANFKFPLLLHEMGFAVESANEIRNALLMNINGSKQTRQGFEGSHIGAAEEPIEQAQQPVKEPDKMIHLIPAPTKKFEGRIFFVNDWNGGDKDNQNVAEELNRNSRIKQNVTVLSDVPNHKPQKVVVDDLVTDAHILARASKKGKIAIAMGAHSSHMLAWLTKLPPSDYNYDNIVIVSHSNWNEVDGRRAYEANKKPGDPPLEDTDGKDLRRGLYVNLTRISDLGVKVWEIPRTDMGHGGWGGKIVKSDGGFATIKSFDISDLGLVHYLKTGITEATAEQRNEYVSGIMKKPANLNKVNRAIITRYWNHNHGVPGKLDDYLKGGIYYNRNK